MSEKPNLPPMPPLPSGNSTAPPTTIPTGPSENKKEFTHGWNDPPKEIKKSDSDNPLRRKKEKKTTPATSAPAFNAFNPSSN